MSLKLYSRQGRTVSVAGSTAGVSEFVFSLEGLESRQLYAATLPKIGDVLGYLATDFSTRPEAALSRSVIRNKVYAFAAKQPNADLVRTTGDTVLIKAVANSKGTAKLITQLEALGASVTGSYGVMVSAAVPVSALAKVNDLSTLQYADASYAPITSAGKTDDYGVQAMNSDKGAKQYAVDGTGVTVGVISDSYNDLGGASAGVTSGDLPAGGVNVLKEDPFVGTDEGRAMAEIVHDVAPGSPIAFYTAYQSEADFAAGIVKLAQPTSSGGGGAKVIVDDVAYLDEPFFQDGVVAQAVNTAVTTYGASYFSAAGNQDRQSYESDFNATASMTIAGAGTGVFQDFDTSAATNVYQQLSIPAGGSVQLAFQWNAPYFSASSNAGGANAPTNSLGIYLLNSTRTTLLTSQSTSRVGGDAYQIMSYTNSGAAAITAYVAIKVTAGAAPGHIKYVDYAGDATIVNFATNSGTAVGHAVATNGRAIGAAFYGETPAFNSPAIKEDFSSSGGVPIYFNPNGTAKASTEFRNQPSVVGPDGAATTFFGGLESTFDGQYHFFGTSAASPHVAAVAALIRQANPSLAPAQVYSALETTALDMGTSGFDYDTGYGLVRADQAIASVAASSISGVSFKDLNSNGVKDGSDTFVTNQPIFIDVDNDGVRDASSGVANSSSAVAIPDATAANNAPSKVASSITTAFGGRVTGITVSINETHTFQGDIGFTLITPSGARIPLLTNLGYIGAAGTGINLTLSDAASTYITSVYNPSGVLAGTYKPQTPLSAAIGENAAGTWQLEARDYRSTNTGTLNSWSMNITYADPQTTTDGNGAYTFAALTPSAFFGTYRVRTGTAPSGTALTTPASPYDLTVARSSTITGDVFGFASTLSTVQAIGLVDGSAQRSRFNSLKVTLNGTITAGNIAAGAFSVVQTTGAITSYTTTVASVISPVAGQTEVILTFSGPGIVGNSIADGKYVFTIDGSKITDSNGLKVDALSNGVVGSIKTYNFSRLFGDVNGNGTVDITDFNVFAVAFGVSGPAAGYSAPLDYDGNLSNDINDFNQFAIRFGTNVP